MISPISPSLSRIGDAAAKASSSAKTSAASFTRQTSSGWEPTSRSAASKIKDQGGIDPTTGLYGQIMSYAEQGLTSWTNGMRVRGAIRLPFPTPAQQGQLTPVLMLGMGNGVRAVVQSQGNIAYDVRFGRGSQGNALVTFNGQVLTPHSPPDDLTIAQLIAREVAR